MGCSNGRSGQQGEHNRSNNRRSRCRNRERVLVNSASFASFFTGRSTAKFFAEFINGRCIEESKNNTSIQLVSNRIYQVSYSYSLEMDKCGSFEVTPQLNGDRIRLGSTRVTNFKEGRVTAVNTFLVDTCSCANLTFNFRAENAETGRRPFGQISIVDLGRACDMRRFERDDERTGRRSSSDSSSSSSSSSDRHHEYYSDDRYWLEDNNFEERDSARRGSYEQGCSK